MLVSQKQRYTQYAFQNGMLTNTKIDSKIEKYKFNNTKQLSWNSVLLELKSLSNIGVQPKPEHYKTKTTPSPNAGNSISALTRRRWRQDLNFKKPANQNWPT